MLKSSWRLALAAKRNGASFARVVRPTGWKGSYHRKAPSGVHQCLPRTEMAKLIARLEA